MRKEENKNYRFVPLNLTHNRKYKKKCKKIKKTKKHHYGVISSQNSLVKAKRETK